MAAQGALVDGGVAQRPQQNDDLSRLRLGAGDQSGDALGEQAGFGLTPGSRVGHATQIVVACPGVPAALVGQQKLDDRLLARVFLPGGAQGGEARAHAGREDPLDSREDHGTAAEVARQGEAGPSLGQQSAALAKETDVGVTETVDRLQLVADREQVVAIQGRQHLELARVGVLELVHHQQVEALGPCFADIGVCRPRAHGP